jgi:hypothetical protein
MPYPNEHAVRITSPSKYKNFRRSNDKFGPGVSVTWGITDKGEVEVQSLRFDKTKFDTKQVKSWLSDHKNIKPIKIEPAKKESLDLTVWDKYKIVQESISVNETVIVQEVLQSVQGIKDIINWFKSETGKKFFETAKSKGISVLNWAAVILSTSMFVGLLYVLFERYRKKHGDKVAAEKLINKLEREKKKLNKDPKIKKKYDSKINQGISKVKSFKFLSNKPKRVESVI